MRSIIKWNVSVLLELYNCSIVLLIYAYILPRFRPNYLLKINLNQNQNKSQKRQETCRVDDGAQETELNTQTKHCSAKCEK